MLEKLLGPDPNHVVAITTKGQSPFMKIMKFVSTQMDIYWSRNEISLLAPTFVPIFSLQECIRIFVFDTDPMELNTPFKISLHGLKIQDEMLTASLLMDWDRIRTIREVVCPDNSVVLPSEKMQVQIRLSNSSVPKSVITDLNQFNSQMFKSTKSYAFSANFTLRDLIYVSFNPKQVLHLCSLSPFGIFSATTENILTTMMKKPELLRAINTLLEDTVVESLPPPGQEEEDVVVEDGADKAEEVLIHLDTSESASAVKQQKLAVAQAQRQEVKSALARGDLDASLLLRQEPKPQREARRGPPAPAEEASTIVSGSDQHTSAPGILSSTPAGAAARSEPPLSVSAVTQALNTPATKGQPKKRDLKQQFSKVDSNLPQLTAVEIARLANSLKENPENLQVLLSLAQETQSVLETVKEKKTASSFRDGDEEDMMNDLDDQEEFKTPDLSQSTGKSVSFGLQPSQLDQSVDGAAALGSEMEDCDIKVLSQSREYLYRYRKPVKGFPVPHLRWTAPDLSGKRKYYYEDHMTGQRLTWNNYEMIFSLVNHHLILPENLNVDTEVQLKSGAVTIKDLIENGFEIMEKDQEQAKWGWRDNKEDSFDEEVEHINSDKPPPYNPEEPVYQEPNLLESENQSTLLLKDQDVTMTNLNDSTKLPPGFEPSPSAFSAVDSLQGRTAAGVQSPTSSARLLTTGRGRGRGGHSSTISEK